MAKLKPDTRPLGSPQSWAKTPGTYISAQAHIDGADHAAVTMEQKWGVGRLRLLVSPELRDKFDRQRYLFNQAVWHGDLEAVRRESERMTKAWMALDGAAVAAGALKLSPSVWELTLANGTVVALVRSPEDAKAVVAEKRQVIVYTLEEIGRMLENYHAVTKVKEAFPGATVTVIRQSIEDPLDRFVDTAPGLDDPLSDILTDFGA